MIDDGATTATANTTAGTWSSTAAVESNNTTMTASPEQPRRRQLQQWTSPRRAFGSIANPAAATRRIADARKRDITKKASSPRSEMKLAAAHKPTSTSITTPTKKSSKATNEARRNRSDVEYSRRDQGVASRPKPKNTYTRIDKHIDTSNGREGRKFAVANVGNHGRIYLRPSVRAATERYAQPNITFPITPPSTAGLERMLASRGELASPEKQHYHSQIPISPMRSPVTPGWLADDVHEATPYKIKHQRAYSYSTVDEQHTLKDPDQGTFKIVIERPASSSRPKSVDGHNGVPMLEVSIPSYKLGTPRWSTRGTPFLRAASYATHTTTDDVRSSIYTQKESPQKELNSMLPEVILTRRHSHASPQPFLRVAPPSPLELPSPPPTNLLPSRIRIEPSMYDALTFKPSCDDRSVVRYSSATGIITAATPPRLVAEITSPTFLDYDLLSDFFLTFRSFLSTQDLLTLLFARLQWALERNDEVGMVVRVRTFVALRHWILNYFMDDFVVDYELRQAFCDFLNLFVADMIQKPSVGVNKLKILTELKKCWRRTCALFWDGPDFAADAGYNSPIVPGGVAGSRDPKLDPSFYDELDEEKEPPKLDDVLDFHHASGEYNFFAEASQASPLEDATGPTEQVQRPRIQRQYAAESLEQRSISMMSEDFVSCSFPKAIRTGGTNHDHSGAQPIAPRPIYDPENIPTTSNAYVNKRRGGGHGHERSGSFSDSLRDERMQTPVQKVIYKNTELLMTLPFAGSLVRGNLFPPGQAFVEAIAPGTPGDPNQSTTMLAPMHEKEASAMSGPGMKKLLGTVRRALSTRAPPGEGQNGLLTLEGQQLMALNRLPGTAYVPQSINYGARGMMRIDLLGAGIAEDFKKAVQEEAYENADPDDPVRYSFTRHPPRDSVPIVGFERPTSHSTPLRLNPPHQRNPSAPNHHMSQLTDGSKSILILDDTMKLDVPIIPASQTRPSLDVPSVHGIHTRPSMDNFLDSMMQRSCDPTPPNTPPDQAAGIPRRSSLFLPYYGRPRSMSLDLERTPSLDLDGESPEADGYVAQQTGRKMSARSNSKTFSAQPPVSLRRYASMHSTYRGHGTERSFDATTVSDSNHPFLAEAAPAPLRVLRRRPGGDLRANTNVGDLAQATLRRPRSTGSLTAYTDSFRSSYIPGRGSVAYPDIRSSGIRSSGFSQRHSQMRNFSLGALAETSPKRESSLRSTHSSHPELRPSFEAEAQKLAQIPDDEDDGGVDTALLKLEGKFEPKKTERRSLPLLEGGPNNSFGIAANKETDTDRESMEKKAHRQKHVLSNGFTATPPPVETYKPQGMPTDIGEPSPTAHKVKGLEPRPQTTHESMASYSSIPLLERGLNDDTPERHIAYGHPTPESSHPSCNFIDDADSEAEEDVPAGNAAASVKESFLESETEEEDEDDISSEVSVEGLNLKPFSDVTKSTVQAHSNSDVLVHPLRHPPSPPENDGSDTSKQLPPVQEPKLQHHIYKPLPPTPDITPTSEDKFEKDEEKSMLTKSERVHSAHLPFILAFDSEVLAQQFTLIEKDALNEIDWKELIEMRWKNTSSSNLRSWVEFLKCQEPRGVEVVIARFNIMVKWAMSECVLTTDIDERARCIIKYIHIAAHCRRYRNYATMYQLTVALTSNELSRLTKTWARVPAAELRTLQELETLVQPTRNFHNLRAEMEGSGAEFGCIPFVGIYTHDLLFNAQRPSQIASTPTSAPLVNFERCRTTAAIVKNLLRLLEASGRYTFQPIEGITERCLWMAALSDDDIRRHVEALE